MNREWLPGICVTAGALTKVQQMFNAGYQSVVRNRMVPQTKDDVAENKKSNNEETSDFLRGRRSTQPLPIDPDEFGLVPAFVVGDVYAADLPERRMPSNFNVHKMVAQKGGLPAPPGIVLMVAAGRLGTAAGNAGFFGEESAAQISGFQAFADVGHSKHAKEADLRAGRTSWDQPDRYQLLKLIRALRYPLGTALDLAQRHPRVHFANLDMQKKAVIDAVQASATQFSQWHGDDAVVQAVKPGLLGYKLPGIHLDLPTTFGPFRFSPVFTNRQTAERIWRGCELAGIPSLEEQPLAEIIAQVRAQNKASLGTQAATFKSFITANRLDQGQQDKDFASLSIAEIEQPRPRIGHLQCVLEPGFSVPMRFALGLVVKNTWEAFWKDRPGADMPAKWAEKLSEKWSSPVEVPIVPLGLQHRLVHQPTASFHFDHAMARGFLRAIGDMPSSAVITQPPTVAGHGLLLIGDIRPEHVNKMRPEHDANATQYSLSFDNLAAVQ